MKAAMDRVGDGQRWMSETGFEIECEYGPWHLRAPYEEALGAPGSYPFTRHVRSTGYRDQAWRPALYSGFGEPADANERFRFLLAEGNGRVSVAFDLPTQLGLDSDDPRVRHEVGRVGVAIDSLADFEVLLEGIPIERVPVTMNMNALAPVAIAMLVAVARRRGVPLASLSGTISNDILHELACRGLCVWDIEPSLRLQTDTAQFIIENLPRFWPFNIRPALLHEIKASPAEELGISLAIARKYLDLLTARGVSVDAAGARISFLFATSPKLFEEAAKLRAARRMWAHMLHDMGARDERAQKLHITAVACNGSHFTREDPELNLVRSALGVLASALGGVQTMIGTAMDEAYEIPSDRAQELAMRVQQIIALESDVCATVDPLGGSYFIEAMTDKVEAAAADVVEQIESWGGIVAAIASDRIQEEMRDRGFRIWREVETGERPVVGSNVYRSTTPAPPMQVWEPDPSVTERRIGALLQLRKDRDDVAVRNALADVEESARNEGESIMPSLIAAVEAYATVGEISASLSRVFQESQVALAH